MKYLFVTSIVFICSSMISPTFAQEKRLSPEPQAQQDAVSKPIERVRCDESCVRANAEKASAICARRIEAQAPGDFDWITRPFTGIFQQADPSSGDEPVAIYRGDSIRFMSPQRDWVRVSYECSFDVEKSAVVGVRVRPGRIDKPVALQAPATPAAANNQETAQAPSPQVASAPLAAAILQAAKHKQAPVQPPKVRIGEPSPIDISQINPRRGNW